MTKPYDEYCPVATALDLVGERWSLLIVRELLAQGPLRYSDLHRALERCGTNILATRLKDLERGGVVHRRKLPPPAASTVYELTEYGRGLRPVLQQLAHWGARVMGPPSISELEEGWLFRAVQLAVPVDATRASIEFRFGGEVASFVDGDAIDGPIEHPDTVISGEPMSLYRLFVDRDPSSVDVSGKRAVLQEILASLPPVPAAVAVGA